MAYHAILIMVEGIDCCEDLLCRCMYPGFFKNFADCCILDGFSKVYLSAWKAPLAYIRRIRAAHQQHRNQPIGTASI